MSKTKLKTFILHQLADSLTQELILDHSYSPQEEKYADDVQKELADEFRTRADSGELFDKLMAEALKSALAKASKRFPKATGVRHPLPLSQSRAIRVPDKLKRHRRVPVAKKADSPWLSKDQSLRAVFGVVTTGDKIELVYVRNCDPARFSSTYEFWTEDVGLRWHWTPDRGVFSMDGVTIAPELVSRIEKAVGKKLDGSKL